MARKKIHPELKKVSYFMLNGTKIELVSCYYKAEKMMLENDIDNHPAWRDDKNYVNESLGNIAKFKQKFNISTDTILNVNKE